MKGMTTCKICGRDFPLISEERYTVRDNEKTGIAVAFDGSESILYDAFDCPHCGCQNIVQERKRMYNAATDSSLKIEEKTDLNREQVECGNEDREQAE